MIRTTKTLLALSVLIPVVLSSGACTRRTVDAKERIMAAWDVANSEDPVTSELRESFAVPERLEDREQIAEWLFREAARLDAKGSAAYYNLAMFYLDDRDCGLAVESLRRHVVLTCPL
jgi:hypothetical protein